MNSISTIKIAPEAPHEDKSKNPELSPHPPRYHENISMLCQSFRWLRSRMACKGRE